MAGNQIHNESGFAACRYQVVVREPLERDVHKPGLQIATMSLVLVCPQAFGKHFDVASPVWMWFVATLVLPVDQWGHCVEMRINQYHAVLLTSHADPNHVGTLGSQKSTYVLETPNGLRNNSVRVPLAAPLRTICIPGIVDGGG